MTTLPDYENVPPSTDDTTLLGNIILIFKDYRDKSESLISEFPNELQWLIGLLSERASNQSATLFQCGFIFLQENIAINISKIADLMYLSNTQVSQRLKNWPTAIWNIAEKKQIIHEFQNNCDLRSWSLRKLPKNSTIKKFINSQLNMQTPQPISEMNVLPPPQVQKVNEINMNIFTLSKISNRVIFDQPPNPWKFDQNPKKILII